MHTIKLVIHRGKMHTIKLGIHRGKMHTIKLGIHRGKITLFHLNELSNYSFSRFA